MKKLLSFILSLLLLTVACRGQNTTPTPTAPALQLPTTDPNEPTATPEPNFIQTEGVFISEMLPGVEGGNNTEFIELYNAGSDLFDLNGHSLVYQQSESRDPQTLFSWTETTFIPPQGHYLLVRDGSDFGVTPDALFEVPISGNRGMLTLQNGDEVIETSRFVWGDEAPAASAPATGESLERRPGGDKGNGFYSAESQTDLQPNPSPGPQNTGSTATPPLANTLQITVELPEMVTPGSEFSYVVRIQNPTDSDAENVTVSIPFNESLTLIEAPTGAELSDNRLTWTVDVIKAGVGLTQPVYAQAPFALLDTTVSGAFASADETPPAVAPPIALTIAGGSLPISAVRDQLGETVTIEGVATMYTGGFFAGSTGTKFYIEDGTGGIQVYVPGGNGNLDIAVGDRVKVTGYIEPYRDSIELIPNEFETDIEVIEQTTPLTPTLITAEQNETDDTILGRLTVIEGRAAAIEEGNFDFKIDLIDENGYETLVLIEKDTGVTAEPMQVGELYRVTGISEFYQGERQIKPRFQTDIAQVFPPIVRIDYNTPPSVALDSTRTHTLTIVNGTPDAINNIVVSISVPQVNGQTVGEVIAAGNGNVGTDNVIYYGIGQIDGGGASAEITYTVVYSGQHIATTRAEVRTDAEILELTNQIYVGQNVPIGAVQGVGDVSPYVNRTLTTRGHVTGIFPELSGFFIQYEDGNLDTSDGLFVLMEPFNPETIAFYGRYDFTGKVREISGQTTLYVTDPAAIVATDDSLYDPVPIFDLPVAWDPPQDSFAALQYNESLEGMLVKLTEPAIAVAPTTHFGETAFVYERWGVDAVTRTDNSGYLMFTDDGSTVRHEDGSTIGLKFVKGDRVANIIGPLAYTFGNYKIEPINAERTEIELAIAIERAETSVVPVEIAEGQFAVATFNAENFFDRFDPHPSNPPRPGRTAYEQKVSRLGQVIVQMGAPDVIGLQEVENLGVLEDLANSAELAPYNYTAHLIEGTDDRGIDNGYLVRDTVTVNSVVQYPPEDSGLTSRPPLALEIEVAGRQIFVLNNHFSSLSAGEEVTEPRRTAQAGWNVSVIEELRAAHPNAEFVVLGDLNSFWKTLPLDTLENAGLTHVYESTAEGDTFPYTYIFNGRTQSLDHIFVTPTLFANLVTVDALEINTDYPLPLPEDLTPNRVSDHNPLIAVFDFNPPSEWFMKQHPIGRGQANAL